MLLLLAWAALLLITRLFTRLEAGKYITVVQVDWRDWGEFHLLLASLFMILLRAQNWLTEYVLNLHVVGRGGGLGRLLALCFCVNCWLW